MNIKKIQKSAGQISGILLILGIILFVVIVVVFVIIRGNSIKNASKATSKNNSENSNQPPKPIYETTISDVRFVFESAQDLGSVLQSKDVRYQPNLTTTEKFIKVIIGAQDKGKVNVVRGSWDVGNIVDSDGRNFVSINDQAYYFLPNQTLCGALLKPEFEPIPCIKLYEVSRASTNLKIEVNFTGQNSSKKQESFIDLLITQ